MGERLDRTQEVSGSNPLSSINMSFFEPPPNRGGGLHERLDRLRSRVADAFLFGRRTYEPDGSLPAVGQ